MNRRDESRREADRKRWANKPSRRWYPTKAWKLRRAAQLNRVPWCEPCKRAGRSRPATVANHNPPHKEDRFAFFHGPLESCCQPCHDSAVQRAELEGFRRDVGDDGWPLDSDHPFNRRGHGAAGDPAGPCPGGELDHAATGARDQGSGGETYRRPAPKREQ